MKQEDNESFTFSNKGISYNFQLDHGSIKIIVEDQTSSSVYQGLYSNDNLPQAFNPFFENTKDLFISLQSTEHQCIGIFQAQLTIDVAFMNKKKRLILPLQKNQEPIQKKLRKQIKKFEEKVKSLQNQLNKKDLIILQQANQLQSLRFIVQNLDNQFQRKIQKKQEQKKKMLDNKLQFAQDQIQRFVLDPACKFTQNYNLSQKQITKTQNQGAYYQLWGQKLDKNKRYCLQVKFNKLSSSSFGIGIQTNNTFDQRWIHMQNTVIQYYGNDHYINYLGKSQLIKNKDKLKSGAVVKIVVQNKKTIEFYINGYLIYQNIIQKNYLENDLFPFIELKSIGDKIQIL